MGSGSPAAKPLPPPPTLGTPDLMDQAVLQARRAAARTLSAKRGLRSTFLTGPQAPDATQQLGTSFLGTAGGGG